jgi:hypothetical protein
MSKMLRLYSIQWLVSGGWSKKKWHEVKAYGRGAAMLGVAVAIKVKATRI